MKDHYRHAVERVEAALERIRAGKMVILTDDEDRENEGDLCMAADAVTPEAINFMAKHGRGARDRGAVRPGASAPSGPHGKPSQGIRG